MTDRGLPIVDGAPACPFVAFDDDRDARATSPDHRHRCYAEVRPAPRALAHQEAYCLASAFPVCPTFQDWARREAAKARAAGSQPATGPDDLPPEPRAGSHPPDDDLRSGDRDRRSAADERRAGDAGLYGGAGSDRGLAESLAASQRNPPRDWAAPPPWMSRTDDEEDEEPDVQAQPPVRGGGLAGSVADRLAGGPPAPPPPWARRPIDEEPEEDDEVSPATAAAASSRGAAASPPPTPAREPRPPRDDRRAPAPALPGPSWERPRRMEAYPTLKTRMGLGSLSMPPILVGVAAVVLAAVALFFLPTLLGLGNPPAPDASPSPSVAASPDPSASVPPPTPTPGPTQQIYVVQGGDTMSRIADRFGVPLQALIDANSETIPNPDLLEIGQEVIIPAVAPTTLPGATPAP
ncbi:MAG TPA: LysM peptidoglycan-binding domain-containing protein [Candidatus Limnocylindrales bacterium]|nr:LysM peptidoglycan-binding domain-containing protein [Candidatus Limnocylindrales bacterium]